MKSFINKYGGIVFGACYGYAMRLVFEHFPKLQFDFTDLFSVTFIWIVPVILGITPMLFATREQLKSMSYLLTRPVFTVFLFFVVAYITRIEDIICLLILALPFMAGALVGGYVISEIILKYRKRKGILYSVLLIPFLAGAIEEQFKTDSGLFQVRTAVLVNAAPEQIWENIVRVEQIREHEYTKGFFNYAGIPSPLFAELDRDTLGGTRTGHFEGGLEFREKVTQWDKYRKVGFDITVVPASIRQTVFDRHVLKSGHFRFLGAAYELKPVNSRQTMLILSSSYQLNTNVNVYAAFWGNQLLTDFQERLLAVIKKRCDAPRANE